MLKLQAGLYQTKWKSDMTNKPPPRSVPLKKRKLNIVYFLDSSKSKSFQISLRTALFLVAAILGIQIWALGSIFTNSKNVLQIQLLSSENKNLRKSLFDYQTRYDGAYAAAYPDNETSSSSTKVNTAIAPENLPTEKWNQAQKLAAKGITATKLNADGDSVTASEFQKPVEHKVSEPEALQTKKSTSSVEDQGSASKVKNEVQKTTAGKTPPVTVGSNLSSGQASGPASSSSSGALVEGGSPASEESTLKLAINNQENTQDKKNGSFPQISNAKVEQKDGKYLVKFELRSVPANTQLSGHLWLVGEFERDGKKVFYTSPKSVDVDDSGMIKATNAGERYRVRNFTAKFLTLTVDAAKTTELRKMSIGISDEAGNKSSFPIDLPTVSGELGQRSKGG